MSDPDQTVKPRMSRGLRIIFGLSLALNLLVIAAIGGAWLRHGGPPGANMPRGIGQMLYRELPREDRRALRQNLRESFDRGTLKRVRVGSALDEALRAEPFDVAAVRDLMAAQSNAMQEGQAVMQSAWLEILDGMSRDDRVAYADRLRDAMRDKRRFRKPDDS